MNAKGNVKKPLITLRQLPNVRSVPEAEVDVNILNVGFGGVDYQGVTESEAGYIGGGPTGHTYDVKVELIQNA